MENSFQTSFIPKKPIMANSSTSSKSGTVSISMIVSLVILIVVGLATGGLYLYKGYLLQNKADLSANLFKIRDSFDRDTISELELYDKRSSAAIQILNDHIVLSPLFELINKLTLSSIQYTKFDHTTTNKNFSVKMSGIATDYKSIALQADVFGTSQGSMIKDLIFSNLTRDKNNYVTFDVEFSVDPKLLSYKDNVANRNIDTNDSTVDTNNSPNDPLSDTNNPADSTSPLTATETQ